MWYTTFLILLMTLVLSSLACTPDVLSKIIPKSAGTVRTPEVFSKINLKSAGTVLYPGGVFQNHS